MMLRPGQFVWVDGGLGFGKFVSGNAGALTVSFFRSIASSFSEEIAERLVHAADLPAQSRAYIRVGSEWRVGRIVGVSPVLPDGYEIRFPNGIVEDVPAEQLEVRCLGPALDPTDVLAAGGMETQYLHDRRADAVRALLQARAAARGLSALQSASIELVPHQVEIVRRVLLDPLQRYLLADEVGMGKTIEAAIVLRQVLVDQPEARILVLAPRPLVPQWHAELREKFDLHDLDEQLRIAPFDELLGLARQRCDLLIVDEAHNLVQSEKEFVPLAALAHATPRLLLLSATPVIGAVDETLAMLHLLDPTAYPLGDRDGFLEKVDRRREYGQILLGLDPEGGVFGLRRAAARALDAFTGDSVVHELAGSLAQLGRDHDPAATARTVRSLQRHIADTYRLHQRLLRTRRRDAVGWELLPRKGEIVVDEEQDERVPALADLLESWRLAGAAFAADQVQEGALARRYARLWEALGQGADELARELAWQSDALAAGAPTFPDEAEIDAALHRALAEEPGDAPRTSVAAELLRLALRGIKPAQGAPRIVAFTSSSAFARALQPELARLIGRHSVFVIWRGLAEIEVQRALAAFEASEFPCVLLCDESGEEGLNLQFAHGIVHLDLPLSLSRLEQRCGRLDRFGRTEPLIHQRVLLPVDDAVGGWRTWLETLRDGFHLFDRSIADLQSQLDRFEALAELLLFRRGAVGLRTLGRLCGQEIAALRLQLDEAYALDQLTLGEEEGDTLVPDLLAFEQHTPGFARALDDWLLGALQFGRAPLEQPHGAFALHWSHKTLVPERPWRRRFAPGLARPLTYDRGLAVRRPGVRLLRPGMPLIDELEQFTRFDDRGTVFGTWRMLPNWPSADRGIWFGFQLCYAVEASVETLPEASAGGIVPAMMPALRRAADEFLPPWLVTVYVDGNLQEVTEPALLALLEEPYSDRSTADGGRDYNLGSRVHALWDVITPDAFAELCRTVRARSEEIIRGHEAFICTTQRAAQRAASDLALRSERLLRRAEAERREGRPVDTETEREARRSELLAAAVATPSVRLDAIGVFVISDQPPPEHEP